MIDSAPNTSELERLPTGIPGLDEILAGGFFRAGVYMIHGLPGSGKTILASQVCFAHVALGGNAIYATLLAESHTRLLQHLRPMRFFDESALVSKLSYISAFSDLEADGLKGLMTMLRREMRSRGATLLVLDGLVAASESAGSDRELKKFIHEIQTNAVFHGCTVLLLTSGLNQQRVNAEHTMVDGLLELEDRLFEFRSERLLQVRKFRGAKPLRGKHAFQISDEGIEVFPRIESQYSQPRARSEASGFLSTGITTLDALLGKGGGLPASSATVVVGSTGTGKTTLGLHFLTQCSAAEPGLLFTFFESPDRLRTVGSGLSIDLRALEASGALEHLWHSQGEHILDELGHRLLEAVARRGVKRLVIDGLSGFFEAATFPERIGRFFSCLLNELRNHGVTVVMALETRDIITSAVPMPYGVSALVDNLIFLRFVEEKGYIKRLISVIKLRGSNVDSGLHRVDITSRGMSINGRFTSGGDVIPSGEAVSGPDQASDRSTL